MAYGLNNKISLKDSIALTVLGAMDIFALGYEKIFWRRTAPHLISVPFEFTKGYLEKLNKKPLRRNSTYYRLRKEKILDVDQGKIKIDINSSWWDEFLNFKYRFFIAPPKWDRNWTVVTYDIPEKNSAIRNKIRKIFRNLGLECWQRSVWLTINPVTSQLRQLLNDWELKDFITVFSGQNIFMEQDEQMIAKLFKPEQLYQKYKIYLAKINKAKKSSRESLKEQLILEFPSLILEDSGLPSEFFPDNKIREKLFKGYLDLINSRSTTH